MSDALTEGRYEWFGHWFDPFLGIWREHLRVQVCRLWTDENGQTWGEWHWEYRR